MSAIGGLKVGVGVIEQGNSKFSLTFISLYMVMSMISSDFHNL